MKFLSLIYIIGATVAAIHVLNGITETREPVRNYDTAYADMSTAGYGAYSRHSSGTGYEHDDAIERYEAEAQSETQGYGLPSMPHLR